LELATRVHPLTVAAAVGRLFSVHKVPLNSINVLLGAQKEEP